MDVTPSTQQCYPITIQNFAAFVCNNSTPHHDQICKRLLSEPITASTNHKTHNKTVLDGENGLTHFRPIRSAILRDGVTWCYPIRFPTLFAALAIRGPRILRPTRLMFSQPMSLLVSHNLVLSGRVKNVYRHLLHFLTLMFSNKVETDQYIFHLLFLRHICADHLCHSLHRYACR